MTKLIKRILKDQNQFVLTVALCAGNGKGSRGKKCGEAVVAGQNDGSAGESAKSGSFSLDIMVTNT